MKKIILLFLFAISLSTYAQGDFDVDYGPDVINPKFNGGGLEKFYEFINKTFDFTKVTKSGVMVVSFTVDKEGAVSNVKVLDFNDIESATEIIRVLNLSPVWESAKKGGSPFGVEIKLPLEFNLKTKSQLVSNAPPPINKATFETSPSLDAAKVETVDGKNIPGGMNAFYKFINENYRQPDVEGLKGKVIISFVIDIDGKIVDIKVLKDIGYGTGKEAIRVLKLCPKWTPGKQDGKPVRVAYTLPINISTVE